MLISEEYRQQQIRMHENPSYGVASIGWADYVRELIDELGATDILDYGCGKERLKKFSGRDMRGYDPAIPGLDEPPEPAELVFCIDVLEHIEPELLDFVLDDLKRVVLDKAFITIDTIPAGKFLPDGRNAHLIQEKEGWWRPKIESRFHIVSSLITEGNRKICMLIRRMK